MGTAGPQRPDRMPEDMPDGMSDRMPEDMSDRMPEDMPDRMPEDMSDRMPEDMPEDMPEHMPEDMPDRMPEDLPVRKCINVMVGITRSKVFFFYDLTGASLEMMAASFQLSQLWQSRKHHASNQPFKIMAQLQGYTSDTRNNQPNS